MNFKGYFKEFYEKAFDTHMLLLETFWRGQTANDIAKNVRFVVVYNDRLNYEEGIKGFCYNLNNVKTKKGSQERLSKAPVMFENDEQFEEAVDVFKQKFSKEFYKEIVFIDKKDFVKDYIETKYFDKLTVN